MAGLALVWALHGPAFAESLWVDGRITMPDGSPAEGLTVDLVAEPGRYESGRLMLDGRWGPEPTVEAATDAEGWFAIEAPGPGMWRVRVEADGFRPMEYQLFPLLIHTLLPDLELTPEVAAEIRILGADGGPAPGGRVRAEGPGTPQQRGERQELWEPAWRQAFAGDDGVARLGRGAEETLQIYAWAPGHLEAAIGGVKDATVRLETAQPFAVTVTDHRGRPAQGVEVRYGDRRWSVGHTGESGSIVVPMAPRGDQTLELVLADGRRVWSAHDPATWTPDEPHEIALPPPSPRHGRLLDAGTGRPIGGGFAWQAGRPGDHVTSDPAGRFSLLLAVEEAEVWLWAAADGHIKEAVLSSGADPGELSIRLPPQALAAGVVVDETGRPLAGVEIEIDLDTERRRGRRSWGARWQLERATSGEDGTFVLGSLHPDASYLVRASSPGFATTELPIPDPASEAVGDLRIVLEVGRLVTGAIVGPGGAPIEGASIEMMRGSSSGPMQRVMRRWQSGEGHRAESDADGRFEIYDLAPGNYVLRVSASGHAPALVPTTEVSEASESTDLGVISLEEGLTIEGRITDLRGTPLSGARVRAAFNDRRAHMSWPVEDGIETLSDSDGEFSIDGLHDGTLLDLYVDLAGYADAQIQDVEAPTDRPVEIELGPTSRVSGRVVDRSGRPVEGAQITPRRAMNSARDRATSDEDGAFVLEEVNPGEVELTTEAEGYVTHHLAHLRVEPGRDLENVTITLERGATIAGRVTDAGGAPVSGASVYAWSDRPFGNRVASPAWAESGSDGRYRLEGVAEGTMRLEAQHEEHGQFSREIEVESGENRFDIAFEESTTITGRVLDELGEPVVGARVAWMRVTLLPDGNRSGSSGGPATVSDSTGRFLLEGLSPGTYDLQADAQGYGDGTVELLEVGSGGVDGVEIRLPSGASIVGRLYGLEPADYRKVQVVAHHEGAVGFSSFVGAVGPDGDYRIDDVGPGTFSVLAEVEGSGLSVQDSVEVPPGASSAVLDLRFEPGVAVTGQVLINGEPLSRGSVIVQSVDGTSSASARTDAQGGFEVRGLEPGPAMLRVYSFDGNFEHLESMEVSDGAYLQVEITTASVSGVVSDASGSEPLAGATVRLRPDEESIQSIMLSWLRPQVTDSTGTFRLAHVPDGSYWMVVSRDGYAPSEQRIVVAAGLDLERIDVLLEPTEGIRVQVFLPGGQPAPSFAAAAVDASGRIVMTDHFSPGESGARLDIPPGRWNLLVSATGSALSSTPITVPSEPLRIVLEPGAQFSIDVPALRNDPVEATVRLTGPGGEPYRFLTGWSLEARWPVMAGRAMAPGLRAGTWVVTVEATDGRVWQGTATLVPGENPEMVLP